MRSPGHGPISGSPGSSSVKRDWRPGKGTPINYLIASFADAPAAGAAVTELGKAGFAGDAVMILDGPEAYEELQRAEKGDWYYRFQLKLEDLFADAQEKRAAYYEDLQRGCVLVLVHAPGTERKERAAAIAKQMHGYHISYRSRWTMEQRV